jgi:hypothetical protein
MILHQNKPQNKWLRPLSQIWKTTHTHVSVQDEGQTNKRIGWHCPHQTTSTIIWVWSSRFIMVSHHHRCFYHHICTSTDSLILTNPSWYHTCTKFFERLSLVFQWQCHMSPCLVTTTLLSPIWRRCWWRLDPLNRLFLVAYNSGTGPNPV